TEKPTRRPSPTSTPTAKSGRTAPGPTTQSSAISCDPAGLPVRLHDPLFQCADRRPGSAELPAAERPDRLGAMPAGIECDRRWHPVIRRNPKFDPSGYGVAQLMHPSAVLFHALVLPLHHRTHIGRQGFLSSGFIFPFPPLP